MTTFCHWHVQQDCGRAVAVMTWVDGKASNAGGVFYCKAHADEAAAGLKHRRKKFVRLEVGNRVEVTLSCDAHVGKGGPAPKGTKFTGTVTGLRDGTEQHPTRARVEVVSKESSSWFAFVDECRLPARVPT